VFLLGINIEGADLTSQEVSIEITARAIAFNVVEVSAVTNSTVTAATNAYFISSRVSLPQICLSAGVQPGRPFRGKPPFLHRRTDYLQL
jgi:hypothetical protein